jgi:mannose-1-phosphate guanylyltransferase / phosphomannomutase
MQTKVKQAVILSAGFGTRLREITGGDVPKVMVPMLGKPLLEWHIEQFKKHGVEEFFINLHYLPEKIKDYFGDGSKWGVKINYFFEEEKILGTAGGVKDFDGMLHGDFFMIYGDILSLADYSRMSDIFYEKPAGAFGMELIGDTDHPHDSDLVEVDEKLRFLKIHPKPHTELPARYKSMRGIFILNEQILPHIPAATYYEVDHQLLPDILAKGERFYGYESDDYLKDIGTPERYHTVEAHLKKLGY